MSGLTTKFFGPLDKGSCVYFLVISVIFFIALVILLGNEIIYIIQNIGKLNMRLVTNGFIIIFNVFVAYFVNRLLYTMCNKSLA